MSAGESEALRASTGEGSWIGTHIGRVIGVALGVLVAVVLIYLAAIGFWPALGLIVFWVAGLVLIIGGGKIHRA